MKRVVMAALSAAAMGVSLATPASADVVVYSYSGAFPNFTFPQFNTTVPGTYEFSITGTQPLSISFFATVVTQTEIFVGSPPQPSDQSIFGSNNSYSFSQSAISSAFTYTVVLPETEIVQYLAGDEFLYQGIQPGTPLYSQKEFTNLFSSIQLGPTFIGDQEFAITVTKKEATAPVPEPAAWALMILGFGAVGGAMRTRRREALAA